MQLRGFTTPNEHQVEWQQLRIRAADVVALMFLAVLWTGRVMWGQDIS
jgi:energy-coupling factor transport system permease protein